MSKEKSTGKIGEEHAVCHLIKKGYKILEKNWMFRHKEIDIIACNHNLLIIAEVKSRTLPSLTEPEDSVTKKKQRFLIQAANDYIIQKNINFETRFDIITVVFSGKDIAIEHIEDAFSPDVTTH